MKQVVKQITMTAPSSRAGSTSCPRSKTGEHAGVLATAGIGCCGSAGTIDQNPCHHDTSRIAWTQLPARLGEEFPLECPWVRRRHPAHRVTPKPGPIRKVLTHLGEPLEPPPVSPARGPPADWGELVQVHFQRAIFQGRIDELPVIDIHSL
jgi:hypothetical protein